MSPKAIRDYLIEEGFRAKIKVEDEGSTIIESAAGGYEFSIVFFRFEPFDGDLDNYHALLFTSGIGTDEADLKKINKANSDSFHLKAHFDDGIWIEMAVPVPESGLPQSVFEESFSSWASDLPEFVQELI
jgi:Putative bacterial sensory transduction regulator